MVKNKKFVFSSLICFAFALCCIFGLVSFNSPLAVHATETEEHGFIVTKSDGSEAVMVESDQEITEGVDYYRDESSRLWLLSDNLIVSGQGLEDEQIIVGYQYNNPTSVTFNNLKSQKEICIYSGDEDTILNVTVTLKGENQIGTSTNRPEIGLSFLYSNLTFTGDGNLTIYDTSEGFLAGSMNEYKDLDLKFDETFTGKITVWDIGYIEEAEPQPPCAISIGTGTLTIKNGTLLLASETKNAITAGTISIDENLVVYSGDSADELEKEPYTAGKHIAYITPNGHMETIGESQEEFMPWISDSSLPTTAGNWFLTTDVTLSETWEVPQGADAEHVKVTNLCLNGQVIYSLGNDCVINVGANATLNLYDCNSTSQHYFKEDEGWYEGIWIYDSTLSDGDIVVNGGLITSESATGVQIGYQGEFNMFGGSISGNIIGGVEIEGGIFNLYNGTISRNFCEGFAGGVRLDAYFDYIDEDTADIYPALFNMYGGEIEFNIGGNMLSSGGVSVGNGAFNMFNGEISNNTSGMFAGGVFVFDNGLFNMYGGKITKNQGVFGGGVTLLNGIEYTMSYGTIETLGTSKFVMHGGEISYNGAVSTFMSEMYETGGVGGGVLVAKDTTFIADGGIIAHNTAEIDGAGVYSVSDGLKEYFDFMMGEKEGKDPYFCIGKGTPITLADGTRKNIEELEIGDSVRVIDHKTGSISSAEIFYLEKSDNVTEDVFTLHFTNDIDVTVISGHCFFNQEKNKYVNLTLNNVSDYIGKHFYNVDTGVWEELESYEIVTTGIDSYSIVTDKTLNSVANGMLSCGDAIYYVLSNIFEFDDGLKYDEEQKALDIEQYGIWEFSEAQYATQETYDALNLQYIKIAIGKGLITPEQFLSAGDYQEGRGNSLVRQNQNVNYYDAIVALLPSAQPDINVEPGIYFGGTIKIVENYTEDERLSNVLISTHELSEKITIGTGTDTANGENGVKKPQKGMSIGITLMLTNEATFDLSTEEFTAGSLEYTAGQFTTNGTSDDIKYFFADNEGYAVSFNNNDTDDNLTDDYLELKTVEIEEKQTISITLDDNPYTYDGNEKGLKIVGGEGPLLTDFKFEYYINGAWTETKPINAGSYNVRITRPEDDTYNAFLMTIENGLVINKAEQVIVINDMSKIYDAINVAASYTKLGDGTVTIEYKLATEEDDTYTTTAPTNAGNYIIRVSVAEGTNYLAGSETRAFTIDYAKINKVAFGDIAQPVATQTAPTNVGGIAIGSRYSGAITWSPALVEGKFNYNTIYTVTIELTIVDSSIDNYRFADNYTLVKPTSKGWTKSTNSTETKLIYTKTFEKTSKIPQTVEITSDISKIYDGIAVSAPTYTKLGDGIVTIEYKSNGADDSTYITTAPINTGTYIVRVSVAELETHSSGYATAEFAITQATNSWIEELTITGWSYGSQANTPSATAKFGTVVYSYSTEEDGTYTSEVPTQAGFYYVKAEVVGNENYSYVCDILEFEIERRNLDVTIDDKTSEYGEDIVELTCTCEGLAYEDKASDLFKLETDATKTSVVGEYLIWATPNNGNTNYNITFIGNYLDFPEYSTYTIIKAENTITNFTLENWVYGETANTPSATAKFGEIEYMYSKADVKNFSETFPTEIGNYIVKAYIVGNDNYSSIIEEKEFTIYQRAEDVIVKDKNGNEITNPEVSIIDAENGIEPEAVLVIEVVEIENEQDIKASKEALENENKLSIKEKIYGVYDAKLLLNGEEIQPNGNITIKMLIPENLLEKEFKLYHVHKNGNNFEVYNVDLTNIDEDGYITFSTNKLSQFVFVAENDICVYHWILIALLLLSLIITIIYSFTHLTFKKFKKLIIQIVLTLITIASLIIGLIGIIICKCNLCLILTIVNIVVIGLILLGITFLSKTKNRNKKNNKNLDESKNKELDKNEKLNKNEKLDKNKKTDNEKDIKKEKSKNNSKK